MKKEYIRPSVEAYMVKPNNIICTSDYYLYSGNEDDLPPSDVILAD